jgi:drug/metabolite transporter (DMT)-like permease
VPPLAIGLVLVAAVLHVTWNVLLKSAGDPLRAAAAGIAAAGLLLAPVAAIAWWASGAPPVPAEVVALAVASGALEVLYFVLLSAAYRRGDLSVVYPVARGTAPLLAVLAGVVLLGERLPLIGAVGVAFLLVGLLAIQRPWRLLSRARVHGASSSPIPFALGTGVAIAAYSALDRVAVRLVAPWLYAALLWVAMAIGLVVLVLVLDGRSHRRPGATDTRVPVDRRQAVVGGLLTLVAYLLVLGAFAIAPLAAVAPLRESAIVLASAWGVGRLGEAEDRRDAALRLGAAGLVLVGAALLALPR